MWELTRWWYKETWYTCACACVLTRFQIKLTKVLGGTERHYHNTVALYVLPSGHLEGEVSSRDQAILLHDCVHCFYPAVPKVNPIHTYTHRVTFQYNLLHTLRFTICQTTFILNRQHKGPLKTFPYVTTPESRNLPTRSCSDVVRSILNKHLRHTSIIP